MQQWETVTMHKKIFLATTAILAIRAFDPGKPGWKVDADGKLVLKDGNPIYVKEDGSELTVEQTTISRLNAEARGHRERAEDAEKKLAKYAGLDDPEAAKKALETVSKLDQKKLIDAGEVDRVRKDIQTQFETQIAERDQKLTGLQSRLNETILTNALSSSSFIRDNVAVPLEMFQATFAKHFKVGDDGRISAVGYDGNTLLSKKIMGENADVEEAVELLVTNYKHKDQILKANGKSGTGNSGGGGANPGQRRIRRADFNAANPTQQAAYAEAASKGELSILD